MANIKNLGGLTVDELNDELNRGARFVVFQYCISIVVMTFKRSSDIYFVRSGQNALRYSYPFILISLFFGWWGIPWGPIYTIGSFITNGSGGKDITGEIIASLEPHAQEAAQAIT